MLRTLALALAVALTGCSTVSVSTDYDTNTDFSQFQSFSFLEPTTHGDHQLLSSDLVHDRIENAVVAEMAVKGLVPAPVGAADARVRYHLSVSRKISVTTINDSYHSHGLGRIGYDDGWRSTTYVDEYDEGSLVIDVVDAAKGKLVWRGSGTGVVDPTATPQEREERIREAVAEILEDFPPK